MPIGSRDDFDFGVSSAKDLASAARREAEKSQRRSRRRGEESSWARGMRRMDQSDAFEPNVEAMEELRHASQLMDEERRTLRMKVAVCAALLAVVFVAGLCVAVSLPRFIAPGEVLACLQLAVSNLVTNVFTTEEPLSTVQIMNLQPNYFEVTSRLAISVLTMVCGVLLALAGTLYQTVFRNPIAAPTMLGVSSGVNLGVLVLVVAAGSSALYLTGERYVLCYAFAFAILAVVMLGGKLAGGRGSFNVVNMMLVGTVVSQLVGTVTTFITFLYMDDELYEVYFEVQEQLQVAGGIIPAVSLLAVVVTVVPVALMRFSLNSMSFADEDARLMGVNVNALRFVSLICGSVMVTASMIYCGNVAMLSLVVPHVSRFLFGADFRKQFVGNCVLGALVLLLCRNVCDAIMFYSMSIPLGTVVSFVTMPVFIWMIAVQQRSWE